MSKERPEIEGLIDAYWALAYAEGKEGRTTDTPDGDAQRIRSAITDRLTTLTAERDAAKGKLALIVDRIVYSDSYGVPGSDFACCHLCTGGGAPGIPFEHDERCPVRSVERDYEQWFDDIRATEDALRETEALVQSMREALEKITTEAEQMASVMEFNSKHMIAEDSLQDAWHMLKMATEQYGVDAGHLRQWIADLRAALSRSEV